VKCNHEHAEFYIVIQAKTPYTLSKQKLVSEKKTNDENNVLNQQSIMNDFFKIFFFPRHNHISSLCSNHIYWRQSKASGNGYICVVETFITGNGFKKNNNNNDIFCQFS